MNTKGNRGAVGRGFPIWDYRLKVICGGSKENIKPPESSLITPGGFGGEQAGGEAQPPENQYSKKTINLQKHQQPPKVGHPYEPEPEEPGTPWTA